MENPTDENQSETTPSSPSHSSSSSSEFEFAVSPGKPCPAVADELFYKGQMLPLPRTISVSVMRSFLLIHNQSSSSSSAAESFSSDLPAGIGSSADSLDGGNNNPRSLSGSWSDSTVDPARPDPSGSTKLKAVARRCLTKMKPFYEKLRQRNKTADKTSSSCFPNTAPFWPKKTLAVRGPPQEGFKASPSRGNNGNSIVTKTPVSCVPSCPSLVRSSPTRAGASRVHSKPGFTGQVSSDSSTLEEAQSAIQSAIAHCKNSLR